MTDVCKIAFRAIAHIHQEKSQTIVDITAKMCFSPIEKEQY